MRETPSGPGNTSEVSLTDAVRNELAVVQKARAGLTDTGGYPAVQTAVVIICVLVNVIFVLYRPDYFRLFIAASFYLNMYYFIILIFQTASEPEGRTKKSGLSRVRPWLREVGVRTGTGQFSRLFANTIFMNSRALSLGIGLIFTIDIFFALIEYARGLPAGTTAVVIAQCSMIVVFYLLMWKVEPFSTEYAGKVERLKVSLHQRSLSPQLVAGLLVAGFVLALFLFLITIILLPGITLHAFLDQSELEAVGHLFALIAILAVSQYFPIRFIHGFTSRIMAERILDHREHSLRAIPDAGPEFPASGSAASESIRSLLTVAGIYTVRKKTIAGFFPVWVVDLDFSVMTDIPVRSGIRGYLRNTGPGRRQ